LSPRTRAPEIEQANRKIDSPPKSSAGRRHDDRLVIVAIAVQSEESGVRKLAGDLNLPLFWTIGTPELVRTFGDVSAVPTLFLFDAGGRSAAVFYGAPPTPHRDAEAPISTLLK